MPQADLQTPQETLDAAERVDLAFVDQAVARIGVGAEKVLEILQAVQAQYGYLPSEALEKVCELTDITPAAIMGVSTFYNQFRHRPVGKHIIHVCVGTACHVKGASQVYDAFRRHLGIGGDEDTDAVRLFTVEKITCLGCCTLAPAVQIDQVTYGHLTPDGVGKVIDDFLRYEQTRGARRPAVDGSRRRKTRGEIRLGLGSCCIARGSGKLNEAVHQVVAATGVRADIKRVGCVGMCHQTPLLEVVLPDQRSFLYARVRPEDARTIILRHFKPPLHKRLSSAVDSALDAILTDERHEPIARYAIGVRDKPVADFLGKQRHIATEYCGVIDPTDIEEYCYKGGFRALRQCVEEMSIDAILAVIEASGLRGRGGAGFPTHLKWKAVREQSGPAKYVVCNGDEGDPGAFMDRMLMESYPYRIIEGLAIAAYAVGAHEGYFYIRAEYPLAIKRMSEALDKAREHGFIGRNIFGTDFSLDLKIVAGAGAFVCGEETALMASIEGRRGMPRIRPPYPAQSGLWGSPTLINNVETYAAISWIIRNGAEAFAAMGCGRSRGTKVFALAGKIARGGLIEVPMGITIREIVEDIGGGIIGGLRFKAVQIGGPSGGCVPASLAHTPVEYETLLEVGAMMGSGGMVVLDETDCMVDIARYFLEFTQDQSCGRCTFCRIGTRRMLDILERLCTGQGRKSDIEELQRLAQTVTNGSLCGLGKTSPNPILSTLRYFHEEYEAHLEGRCPAGKCRALITYRITDDCIGCTLCAQHCPVGAIAMRPYEKHEIDSDTCIRCDTCKAVCPANAIEVK